MNYDAMAQLHAPAAAAMAMAEKIERERWQPIATAPKGSNIILHYKNALGKDRTVIGWYGSLEVEDGDEGEMTGPTWWESTWANDEGHTWPVEEPPTHWMPLPAPPQSETGAEHD